MAKLGSDHLGELFRYDIADSLLAEQLHSIDKRHALVVFVLLFGILKDLVELTRGEL